MYGLINRRTAHNKRHDTPPPAISPLESQNEKLNHGEVSTSLFVSIPIKIWLPKPLRRY